MLFACLPYVVAFDLGTGKLEPQLLVDHLQPNISKSRRHVEDHLARRVETAGLRDGVVAVVAACAEHDRRLEMEDERIDAVAHALEHRTSRAVGLLYGVVGHLGHELLVPQQITCRVVHLDIHIRLCLPVQLGVDRHVFPQRDEQQQGQQQQQQPPQVGLLLHLEVVISSIVFELKIFFQVPLPFIFLIFTHS